MPEVIQCPHCDRKLKVPENLLGKTVKCPSCGQTFIAEEEILEPPLAEEEEEAPRPSKRRAEPVEEEEDEGRPRRRRPFSEEDESEEEAGEEVRRPRRRRIRADRRERGLQMLKAPAIALLIAGILGVLM